MSDDILFEIEKDYYLGNYQSCINKANSMPPSTESTYYMCLSLYHLKKYDVIKQETKKSSERCVKMIGLLVEFTESPEKRERILNEVNELLVGKEISPKDDLSRLILSSIYVQAKRYPEAIKVLQHLDSKPALMAQAGVLILMNRVELAEKQLKLMQSKEDYSTFILLTAAQIKLASGNFKEAIKYGEELEDVYKATPLIKNIQTAAAIGLRNYDLAKEYCEGSLDLDNENPEALINMIFIMSKLRGSSEIKERHLVRLKTLYPEHRFVKELESLRT